MSKLPLSAIAEVNPVVRIPKGLSGKDAVSFIPMGDVSESGHWTLKQARPLRSVNAGFTAFEDGDVLVAKITPCLENGKGAHAVGLENGIGFGSTEFHVLRARSGNAPRFVFHLTQWRAFRRAAAGQMVGSAGQQGVPRAFFDEFLIADIDADQQFDMVDLVRMAISLPTLAEQDAIIERHAALDRKYADESVYLSQLRAVKSALMDDLLTGRVRVTPLLEPAAS